MSDWPKGPVSWVDNQTMFVSVPFTWNLPAVRGMLSQTWFGVDSCCVGGPAVELMPDYFKDMPWVDVGHSCQGVLQRSNRNATRTTTGCPNRCSFCAVPKIEGDFKELDDWPDLPILCDNNLLAATQEHFDKVCDRLEKHEWCDFNQGLDAELMTDYHAERLSRLPEAIIRMSLDKEQDCGAWEGARQLLKKHGVPNRRIRTYVLCGHLSDPKSAWSRCDFVESAGCEPYPQWFHPLDCMEYGAVMECHTKYGWNKEEQHRIMHYYYQHRGTKP